MPESHAQSVTQQQKGHATMVNTLQGPDDPSSYSAFIVLHILPFRCSIFCIHQTNVQFRLCILCTTQDNCTDHVHCICSIVYIGQLCKVTWCFMTRQPLRLYEGESHNCVNCVHFASNNCTNYVHFASNNTGYAHYNL